MARIRRTPEAAREHILAAARRLLIEEGPRALKLQRVGKEAGMSHASVVHYFGNIDGLTLELVKENHRQRREKLRAELAKTASKQERGQRIEIALSQLADREQGRLLLSLMALGHDPFPPVEEMGLQSIAHLLSEKTDIPFEEAQRMVLANVLVMLGEAMVGSQIRARLGVGDHEDDRNNFRQWMLKRFS